jgi:hypothetical protein
MFFPDGMFESARSGAAQSLRVRLSQTLGEMGEPSLSCGPAPDSYRFVWLQYHLHSPTTTVRVSKTANGWTAHAVQSSIEGRGITRHQATLNAEQSQQMMNAVARFGFWRRADFGDRAHFEDGSTWVVEGRQGTAYRAIVSATEEEDGLRELARVLLSLTEMAPGANLR